MRAAVDPVVKSSAQRALDALAEYDQTRSLMKLVRDMNRIAGRPDEEDEE